MKTYCRSVEDKVDELCITHYLNSPESTVQQLLEDDFMKSLENPRSSLALEFEDYKDAEIQKVAFRT